MAARGSARKRSGETPMWSKDNKSDLINYRRTFMVQEFQNILEPMRTVVIIHCFLSVMSNAHCPREKE